MNKLLAMIVFWLSLFSCVGKHNSDAQKVTISEEISENEIDIRGDTLQINLMESIIYWKGTKMLGTAKHEGEINLKNGYFIIKNDQLVNGTFVVDMTTIGVTDIPLHDQVPLKNLNDHLKNEDFFDVDKFPTSEFQITKINQVMSDSLTVFGNLTIKDVTKGIEFGAKYQSKSITTKFTIDRFQWNITNKSLVDKTMVDKDIELNIKLTMK